MAIGKTNMGLSTVWRVTPLTGQAPTYASTKEEADKLSLVYQRVGAVVRIDKLEKPDQPRPDGENI